MRMMPSLKYFVLLNLIIVTEVFAGPGGTIAKALVNSTWGRIGMMVVFIILSPLIIYVYLKENFAKKRSLKDLNYVQKLENASEFDWPRMKSRFYDCFMRVHSAWDKEDVSEASQWMTSWYWQNQQVAILDAWSKAGLKNVCQVDPKVKFTPLLFIHRNDNGIPHAGSTIHVLASAVMVDYLVDKSTGKVVEGCKRKKDVETIWSFELVAGQWVVDNIEESSLSLDYADIAKNLPTIEETILTVRKTA